MDIHIRGILNFEDKDEFKSPKDLFPHLTEEETNRIVDDVYMAIEEVKSMVKTHKKSFTNNELFAFVLKNSKWEHESAETVLFKIYSIGKIVGFITYESIFGERK